MITCTHKIKNYSDSQASFFPMGTRCQGFSFSAAQHSNKLLDLPYWVRKIQQYPSPLFQMDWQALPSIPTVCNCIFNSLGWKSVELYIVAIHIFIGNNFLERGRSKKKAVSIKDQLPSQLVSWFQFCFMFLGVKCLGQEFQDCLALSIF